MANLTIDKLQNEAQNLRRTLAYLLEENIQLKHRLTEVLKKEQFDPDLLEGLEIFQSRFVQQDKLIGLLRDDLARMYRSADNEKSVRKEDTSAAHKKLQRLMLNTTALENQFCSLRNEFTHYLRENI